MIIPGFISNNRSWRSSEDNSQTQIALSHLNFQSPPLPSSNDAGKSTSKDAATSGLNRRLRALSLGRQAQPPKHVRLSEVRPPQSHASSIYKGSFSHTPRRSVASQGGSIKSPRGPVQTYLNAAQLQRLLTDVHMDLETYEVEELRDGFFDAAFLKPPKDKHDDLKRHAEETLPISFQREALSMSNALPRHLHGLQRFLRDITTTRAGINLAKSILAPFIAYCLCLVPSIRSWLGRYSYIMVISTIINHPGRTVGAQVDGAITTILGTVVGLGWGALALWVSDSTAPAKRGYGGILATFLILFMAPLSALRAYYIKLYQLVLCAGIAIIYTCLAETSGEIAWSKLFDYGIPWVLGQTLGLIVCCSMFPDAGSRPLAVALHNAFDVMQQSLALPQADEIKVHRKLALMFVNLSQAHRDLVIDLTLTRFSPLDVTELRNLMQAVIRSLLSLKMDAHPFNEFEPTKTSAPVSKFHAMPGQEHLQAHNDNFTGNSNNTTSMANGTAISRDDTVININVKAKPGRPFRRTHSQERVIRLVVGNLSEPILDLLALIRTSLRRCDAVLMSISGYRQYLGPPIDVSSNILEALVKIREAMKRYDTDEEALLQSPDLPPTYSNHPEPVEMLLFSRPIRQAVSSTEQLLIKVKAIQEKRRGWRLHLPSYPFHKALQRTNAQVRHDRGGVTAAYFFRSQRELARSLSSMASIYKPLPQQDPSVLHEPSAAGPDLGTESLTGSRRAGTIGKYAEEEKNAADPSTQAPAQKRLRFEVWKILHRLQGFETRFALKVTITTILLSVPAWLEQSKVWWNDSEIWWAVVFAWLMLHPRIGGNVQDLVTRVFFAALGTIWGGLAYGVRNGDPYVMALFAAMFMLPMIYRFTQSPHPRSGIAGCISFVVVSLSCKTVDGMPSVVRIAWTRGLAFVVGIGSAVIINWVLWPFVARHELRKALSSMMVYCSIIYRNVVAKYVYFEEGHEPDEDDIRNSEKLEGRLREGFVRIRQLMALTRHEMRLRGPISPLPYSGLVFSLERFFEYLIEIRQSSLFFHPHYLSDNKQAAEMLLSYRRDAVAAVLMNLYVLATGLRTGRKIPRYLPSAAAARKRLLDHMARLESEQATSIPNPSLDVPEMHAGTYSKGPAQDPSAEKGKETEQESRGKKWSEIYSYSYSQSLTGCVQQLEQLQKYTKAVCGEQGFDIPDAKDFGDSLGDRTGLISRAE